MTAAVILDLDGVLLDSEQVWNEAKRELVEEQGGRWREQAPRDMMGMSSPEWSRYLVDELGVPLEPAAVSDEVVARLERIYRKRLPLLEGAPEAVRRLARRLAAGWRERGAPPPLAPELRDLYVAGFGRPGDGGAVAEQLRDGGAGAAWFRLFEPDRPGYGFVAPDVPELSLAVAPDHRRRGLGSDLLEHALRHAVAAGHREVSLSVEPDNPARRLYERLDFEKVGETGGAWTMIWRSAAL